MLIAPRGAHALMRMAVVGRRSFSFNDRAVDAPVPIVGERPMAAPQLARDVSAARPSRPELPAPYPSWLTCKKAPATNVDLRRKRTRRTRLLGLCHAGLRPVRRRPWRIRRWRFKGLTGDDRTRCAACRRRREAVVAEARWAFVGLTPRAGTVRAPRRPLIPDRALIPIGVDVRQDGAPDGVEFPGAGAPCAPQFRFGPLNWRRRLRSGR
jgi:hypothetical protein